jgi:hypothetical protein
MKRLNFKDRGAGHNEDRPSRRRRRDSVSEGEQSPAPPEPKQDRTPKQDLRELLLAQRQRQPGRHEDPHTHEGERHLPRHAPEHRPLPDRRSELQATLRVSLQARVHDGRKSPVYPRQSLLDHRSEVHASQPRRQQEYPGSPIVSLRRTARGRGQIRGSEQLRDDDLRLSGEAVQRMHEQRPVVPLVPAAPRRSRTEQANVAAIRETHTEDTATQRHVQPNAHEGGTGEGRAGLRLRGDPHSSKADYYTKVRSSSECYVRGACSYP